MSTRGTFIVRKDGIDARQLYIASDAYPGWAGCEVVDLITYCEQHLNGCNILHSMLFEGEDNDFDKDAIIKRLTDGKPFLYGSCNDFIKDSLYCEYAYVIDLDDYTLKFYAGFQTKPDPGGVYGQERKRNGYYPCKHLCTFSLKDIAHPHSKEWVIESMNSAVADDAESNSEHNNLHEMDDDHSLKEKNVSEIKNTHIIVRIDNGKVFISLDYGEWQVCDLASLPDGIKMLLKALCNSKENTIIDAKEKNNG